MPVQQSTAPSQVLAGSVFVMFASVPIGWFAASQIYQGSFPLGIAAVGLVVSITNGFLGYLVGDRREAGADGAVLGAFFGPVGVIAAFSLDERLACSVCGERISGTPRVCPRCLSPTSCAPPDDSAQQRREEAVEKALWNLKRPRGS